MSLVGKNSFFFRVSKEWQTWGVVFILGDSTRGPGLNRFWLFLEDSQRIRAHSSQAWNFSNVGCGSLL